jgi:hypothetical protein
MDGKGFGMGFAFYLKGTWEPAVVRAVGNRAMLSNIRKGR